jgi:hypothetical protein
LQCDPRMYEYISIYSAETVGLLLNPKGGDGLGT